MWYKSSVIRSFHHLFLPARDEDFRLLEEFFSALGFAPGETWNGHRSQGLKFEAFESGVEIAMGEGMPAAELVVEVDNADIVAEAARAKGFTFVSDVTDCDWGARLFVLQVPAGFGNLAVFSYNENWRQPTKESQLDSTGMKFAVVVSRFNAFITERLLTGATDALRRTGARAQDIEIVRVPGAFELPAAAKMLAVSGKYDALVAIGCLLRGDTAHYDVIVNEVTRGIGEVTLATGVPIGFGVLTCDTLEQAIDRAGLKMGNKGFEAALAGLELAALKRTLQNK
jgi:6,7-dimethyl-8-ribityllumazine synthase